MLLHRATQLSNNEFSAHKTALLHGIRFDRRQCNQSRVLSMATSSHPDAHVQLGQISVTALSTAKLIVPHTSRPSKGNHFIKLFAPGFTSFHALESFEQYFLFLWRKSDIVEEESLCLRPGEKVWSVDTKIVIHDDDGGLVDAMFVACYVSLSGLGFPSFDTSTGALFPAW
jgi:exosome complex component RRP45